MRVVTRAPAALALATALLACAPYPAFTLAEDILSGKRVPCQNEGEPVHIDTIDISCFKCICKNGFVECDKSCPDVKNCYMQMPKEGCCVKCKGCLFNGQMLNSSTEWTDPEDPCKILRCEAGIITESMAQCYTPCENPKPIPGQCCPSCLGCYINGQKVSEGRDATISEDPCLKCHCSKSKLTCTKRACPVLPCPIDLQKTNPGECCPVCKEGLAKLLRDNLENKPCIIGRKYHPHAESYVLDKCTKCLCMDGTSICERATCPVLECAAEHQKTTPGECCPHCPIVEEVRSTCTIAGKEYKDGESWRLDECKSCMCHGGDPRCAMEQCPALTCPAGHRKERSPGQCCHRCVESNGVCTVFGDPHYKTFDGKFYSFQGSCKYQLTTDCVNHTFSIRVTNDGRSAEYSSRTKTVSLKMGDTKINLGRKLRVKINGTRVEPPCNISHEGGTIEKRDDTVLVNTTLGINLVWDETGSLEVSVPTSYKGKLCGLCGNYNSLVRDDLKLRSGIVLRDSGKGDIWKFGSSWRVGGRKACSREPDNGMKQKTCNRSKKRTANKKCNQFNKSLAFDDCRHKLNPHNYYESCIMDMCQCEPQTCYCEAFSAYARECQRIGVKLKDWKREIGCGSGRRTTLRKPSSVGRNYRHKGSRLFLNPMTATRPPPGKERRPPPNLMS